MEWLDVFLAEERAWLEDATARGVSPELVEFGDRLLHRLERAKLQADAATYTVQQAAALTNVHPETIRRKARKGEFGERAGRKHIRITQAQLTQLGIRKPTPSGRDLVDHFTRDR